MGFVVIPVLAGWEHYTLPDRPRLLVHFIYTLPRPFHAKRYFVCLVLGPLRAASRDRGYGVGFARHNRYNESRQCDVAYTMIGTGYPLIHLSQADRLKNIHPGPKQTPNICLGS